MGDVVLLVPVVRSLVAAYPDVEVTVVTRPKFASFFTDIERVIPFPADVDHTYNGMFGLRDLFRKLLKKGDYDVVVDMHDHIRTMILRTLFKVFGTRVVVFDKGRAEKKKFTRKENKETKKLPHSIDRYRQALANAGFPFEMVSAPYIPVRDSIKGEVNEWLERNSLIKNAKWIGIAPFAMHTTKIWPVEKYREVIERLRNSSSLKVFLFGGGEKEVKFFNELKSSFPDTCVVVAGELKIKQELALMERLDAMICVDSSNMHFAALLGIPVIAIWGGTHPDVGFGPWGSPETTVLQISRDELPCRPCSVYGRETCYRGDFACLNRITPEQVSDAVTRQLNSRSEG